MAIPLTVLIGERGINGAPTMTGRIDTLRNVLDLYEHSIAERCGYEGMRCRWPCTADEALAWARYDHLMRPCEVYSPSARRVWEGHLYEIKVIIGRITIVYSLKDMVNRLMVRYSTTQGDTGATATFTNATSIALFGTKDRVLNISGVLAAAAAGRAQTELNAMAFPKSTYPSDGSEGESGCSVQLTFKGWGDALDRLLTSKTSTATVPIATQLTALLTDFNATNPWFSATTTIEAGLPSDTDAIEPDTTYREKFDKLLGIGNGSNQPLHWGFYDDRQLVVRTAASASPNTIGYYENLRTEEVRDRYGNRVEPWDLLPDVMVQLVEAIDIELPPGAIDGPFRKYVARVTCRLTETEQSYTLEPGSSEDLESLLTTPTGKGVAGNSDRQSAIERVATQTTRSRFPATDNPARYNGGVWQPSAGGTGVPNTGTIDTGGGNINNTGGGDIDLGTGAGIGVGNPTQSRDNIQAAPRTAKYWLSTANAELSAEQDMSTLGTGLLKQSVSGGIATPALAVAGTDYVAPGSLNELIDDEVAALLQPGNLISLSYNDAGNALTIAVASLNETIDDRVAALLAAGSGIGLSYNDAGNVLTISNTGGTVGGTGTAGRITQWATGGADIENSTLIKSGTGVLTLVAAAAATLTIDSATRLDGAGAAANQVLKWDGTAYSPASLASTDISNWNEAVDDRVAVLLAAGSGISLSYNDTGNVLTISNTGGTVTGTGTANQVVYWSGTSVVTGDTGLVYSPSTNTLNTDTMDAAAGFKLGGKTAISSVSAGVGIGNDSGMSGVTLFVGTSPRANLSASGFGLGMTATHQLQLSTDDAAKTTTTTWITTSDARTKDLLHRYARGLRFLRSLPPVHVYRRNGKLGTTAGEIGVGFVAQDLERVAPEWVLRRPVLDDDGNPTELLKVQQHELSYVLLNAILRIADHLGLED